VSIQEIEKRISQEAETQAAQISKDTTEQIKQLDQVNARKKQDVKAHIRQEAEQKAEEATKAIVVPARLKAKKAILEEKQKVFSSIYQEVQKEKKLSAAEIDKVREDTEVKAAKILFK